MTVPDLLLSLNHPLGSRGRTTCPIHGGHNPTQFWFSDHGWSCLSGCGGGNVYALSKALGLANAPRLDHPAAPRTPGPEIEGMEALFSEALWTTPPRTTDYLTRQVEALRFEQDDRACFAHRAGVEALRVLEATTPLVTPQEREQGPFPLQTEALWLEARTNLDRAHQIWGPWPWPCGCYQGEVRPSRVSLGELVCRRVLRVRWRWRALVALMDGVLDLMAARERRVA